MNASFNQAPRGQAISEYALLLGLVVAVMLGMQVYAKRGLQASVKMAADGLSPYGAVDWQGASDRQAGELAQMAGMQFEAGERRNRALTLRGQTLVRESATRTVAGHPGAERTTRTFRNPGGEWREIVDEAANPDRTITTGALDQRGPGVSSYSEVVISDGDSSRPPAQQP